MQKNLIQEQINKLSKEDILKLSVEQFSGLILKMYLSEKENLSSQYNRIGENPMNLMENYNINNKFNKTKDCSLGILYEERGISELLKTKFDEAVNFLKEHKFIKTASGLSSDSPWFKLTEEGENTTINEDYTLVIKREPIELINRFKKSVFHISGKNKDGDYVNGTCFLFNNSNKLIIVTAKHVVEEIKEEGKIYLNEDKSCSIDLDRLQIIKFENSDAAIMLSLDISLINILKRYASFKNFNIDYKEGEQVISLGFPPIPGLTEISFNSSINTISNPKAENYFERNKNIILNSPISPGYSGGPVINIKGELIGIVSGNLTKSDDSSKVYDDNGPAAIVPFNEFKDMLLQI